MECLAIFFARKCVFVLIRTWAIERRIHFAKGYPSIFIIFLAKIWSNCKNFYPPHFSQKLDRTVKYTHGAWWWCCCSSSSAKTTSATTTLDAFATRPSNIIHHLSAIKHHPLHFVRQHRPSAVIRPTYHITTHLCPLSYIITQLQTSLTIAIHRHPS